jgi:hypothetical protein
LGEQKEKKGEEEGVDMGEQVVVAPRWRRGLGPARVACD